VKNNINILFTSVGRRVELVQAFKDAAKKARCTLKVFGADINTTAPALYYCDEQRFVCRIDHSDYINQLINICKADNINLLIPTIDTDLLLLAREKKRFEEAGTKVLVSAVDKIRICRDKRLTWQFFDKIGLKAPKTFDDVKEYDMNFPCFIKPKDGSSSIDAYRVNNKEELISLSERVPDYIIQPFISGEEFTVDILCDYGGNPIYITPRNRLAVRSGEVLKTRINLDDTIISECKDIIKRFKPCGPLTVQLIRSTRDNLDYYIEINPRFGGGAPLSIKAGADAPLAILQLMLGKSLNNEMLKNVNNDLIFSRFDQSICINQQDIKHPLKAIIFDLDDTLYPEMQYVLSGFTAICKQFPNIKNLKNILLEGFSKREPAVDYVIDKIFINNKSDDIECIKRNMLTAYRNNECTDLRLYPGVYDVLLYFKTRNIKLGIITDGRSEAQRAKIKIMGLDKLIDEIIITDELAGNGLVQNFRKPAPIAFEIMKDRFNMEYRNIIYVGDNIDKDFKAPKLLGMQSMFFCNKDGLYYKKTSSNILTVGSVDAMFSKLKSMI